MDKDFVSISSPLAFQPPTSTRTSPSYGAVTATASLSPSSHETKPTKRHTSGMFCRIRNKLFCRQPPPKQSKDFEKHFEGACDQTHHAATASWRFATVLSVVVAIIAAFRLKPVYRFYEDRMPEWSWDRNVYISRDAYSNSGMADESSGLRISLIAQVTEDLAMKQFSKVSSRPNRAYARQWHMDYTEYYAGRVSYSSKSCFDKTFVLQTLVQKQLDESKDPPPLWPHAPSVRYDAIVLLPSDAIITDMDDDIVSALLPRNKLAAIAGWTNSREKLGSNTGIILFNLAHEYAAKTADMWWATSQEIFQTCGADNGIATLIDAIASVMDVHAGETLEDLIQPMSEYPNGTVGNHVIKCLPSSVPGARSELFLSNQQQHVETIHQTADSVCYRFYPKCEVVL
jgi:hypothetical protein